MVLWIALRAHGSKSPCCPGAFIAFPDRVKNALIVSVVRDYLLRAAFPSATPFPGFGYRVATFSAYGSFWHTWCGLHSSFCLATCVVKR
ncbi:MAG: hypothetical protein ACXU9W_04560 [Thermodesulfobacteriota bacterium]